MSTTFYNLAFVTLEGGVPQAEAALIAGIEGDRVILTSGGQMGASTARAGTLVLQQFLEDVRIAVIHRPAVARVARVHGVAGIARI